MAKIIFPAVVLIIALSIWFYQPEQQQCLDAGQVEQVLERSKQLEQNGELQEARRGYKVVDLFSCNSSSDQDYAIERSMALGTHIQEAYEVTMTLIAQYHQTYRVYPEQLDDVRANVPEQYLNAFNGFIISKKADGTVDIVTGLYGSISFNLN